jgi:hypothetical protein
MIGCYFPRLASGVRIGAVPHVAVIFAFPDGMGFEQDAQRPTLQGAVGLACRFGPPFHLTSNGVVGPDFLQQRPQDSHVPRMAVKNAAALSPGNHRRLGRVDAFLRN